MKKVYFIYETTSAPYGGVNSFNLALRKAFEKHPEEGFLLVTKPAEADILFLSAASRGPDKKNRDRTLLPWQLENMQHNRFLYDPRGFWHSSSGKPVVHRLDGLTSRYGRKSGGGAYDQLQIRLNQNTSQTIFQSQYCKTVFRSESMQSDDHVIPNGVDGDLFPWKKHSFSSDRPLRLIAVSWSSNPKKGHAACAAISELPGLEMFFSGRWPDSIPRKNVRLIEPRSVREMAAVYHQADAFVHLAELDNAANVIVEALATGMPVLYLDSGGNAEMARGAPFSIGISDTQPRSLEEGIRALKNQYNQLVEAIQKERHLFLIDQTCREYAAVFRRALDRR